MSLCSFKGWTSHQCRSAVWLNCSKINHIQVIIFNFYLIRFDIDYVKIIKLTICIIRMIVTRRTGI